MQAIKFSKFTAPRECANSLFGGGINYTEKLFTFPEKVKCFPLSYFSFFANDSGRVVVLLPFVVYVVVVRM